MSLGKTFPLVIAIISSNILNMALCPILILGGKNLPTNISLEIIPPMGAIGASLSNCLSIILVTFILAVFIKRISVRKNGFSHSPIKREMLTALKIGFPIGMQLFAETGVFTIIGFLAGQFGKTGLAANQIALTYSSLMFTLALGIGSAAAVRVGLAVGAANSSQAKKSGLTSLGLGALITIILSFIFIFFPEFLSKIMTDKTEVISASIPLIKIVGIFLIFDGLQGISTGILRGMGDTKYTFVVGMLCHYLVGIPIAFVAGIFLKGGIAYLWGGLCIGLVAIFILLCFRFFKMSSREIARIE
jgi:MATE family multidrug resistance protein